MTRLLRSSALALLFGAAALTGCKKPAATSASAQDADPRALQFQVGDAITDTAIAAIVTRNGKTDTLTTAAFRKELEPYLLQNPQLIADSAEYRNLRRQVVEEFVMRPFIDEVVRGDASLSVDTAVVNGRMRELQAREGFDQQIASMGLTVDSVRAILTSQARQQQLFEKWSKTATRPTAAEMEAYRKKMAEEVRVQHIIFATKALPQMLPLPAAQQDSVRRVALAVLDSIKTNKGGSFQDFVRRHSAEAVNGGDGIIDFFGREGQYDPAFKRGAFALRDSGDVLPDLVESTFGYHIIKMLHRREGALADTATVSRKMMEKRGALAVRDQLRALLKAQNTVVRINTSIVDADLNTLPPFDDPESI